MPLGILNQARLRPVTSDFNLNNPNTGFGVGVVYGFAIGSARLAGISYTLYDASGQYDLHNYPLQARLVAINGNHPAGAHQFTIGSVDPVTGISSGTDLSPYELLYDAVLSDPGPKEITTWFSGIATDDGLPLTVMLSQIQLVAPPNGIIPTIKLLVHADHYATKQKALSQGPIQTL